MIIHLRYHIFTITAIFAALGLGILIGSSLIGHEGLIEEQRDIIQNIRDDIINLKKENNELAATIELRDKDLSSRKELERKLFNILLKDYMSSEKLFLIYSDLGKSKVEQVTEYFKIMGAEVELLEYKHVGHESVFQNKTSCEAFDRLISWNMKNSIFEQFDGVEVYNTTLIEYTKGDVLGLMLNILTEIEKSGLSINTDNHAEISTDNCSESK
ncbi:MAG: copper transporter [Halanaerobiales bacterium]